MSAEIAAHMVGDYLAQSDWMAQTKTSRSGPALAHAASYAACFLPITRDPRRLAAIGISHFVIDRWRLARYVVWAKNQLAPAEFRYLHEHADNTGYHQRVAPYQQHEAVTGCTAPSLPVWMSTWLLVWADNAMHLVCNRLALRGNDG